MELPKAEHPVLAWDGVRWVRAIWVPKYTREQGGDFDAEFSDYRDEDDVYYWPEGWYELQHHGQDEMNWHIDGGIKCWQELPPRPIDEIEQGKHLKGACHGN